MIAAPGSGVAADAITPATRRLVLVASEVVILAAAPLSTPSWIVAAMVLLAVGSTSRARLLARGRGARLALQVIITLATIAMLVQLQQVSAELLTTKVLPLLLAFLVLRAPTSMARRDVAVDLVIACMTAVVCAAAATSFQQGAPLLLAWPLLLMAASRLHHDGMAGGSSRPGLRTAAAVPAVAACVVALLAWLILPSGQSPGLRHRLGVTSANPFLDGGSGDGSNAPGGRTAAAYTGSYLDLSMRGDLPDDPVLRVPAASPALWRAQVFTSYTGRYWTTRQSPAQLFGGGPLHQLRPDPDLFLTTGVEREDTAVPLGPALDVPVWAPGIPTAVDTRGRLVVDSVGVLHVLGTSSAPAYVVRSVVATADAAQLRTAHGADPNDTRWVSLPPSIPTRVAQLARSITSGSDDRYTAMKRVEAWLRTHVRYDLNAPVPASGADAVDEVLFTTHRGFCEHFASAEAVLLRSLGVPARVVSGLAEGVPGEVAGTRELRASDAHAWVEVYFPGVGWVSSDPTAGAVLASASGQAGLWPRAAKALHDGLTSLAAVPGGRRTLSLVVAVLAAGLLWWGRRSRPAPVLAPIERVGRRGPVLLAFLTYEQRRRLQHRRRRSDTPREYVAAAGDLPLLGDALVGLEEECYGRAGPEPARAVAAVRAFEDAQRSS